MKKITLFLALTFIIFKSFGQGCPEINGLKYQYTFSPSTVSYYSDMLRQLNAVQNCYNAKVDSGQIRGGDSLYLCSNGTCVFVGLVSQTGGTNDTAWSFSGANIYNRNSGYVGIGTSSPSDELTINVGFHNSGHAALRIHQSEYSFDALSISPKGTTVLTQDEDYGGHPSALSVIAEGSGSSGNAAFNVTQNGSSGNACATFQGGNVGIGTTSPTAALEVNGTFAIDSATSNRLTYDPSINQFVSGTVSTNTLVVAWSNGNGGIGIDRYGVGDFQTGFLSSTGINYYGARSIGSILPNVPQSGLMVDMKRNLYYLGDHAGLNNSGEFFLSDSANYAHIKVNNNYVALFNHDLVYLSTHYTVTDMGAMGIFNATQYGMVTGINYNNQDWAVVARTSGQSGDSIYHLIYVTAPNNIVGMGMQFYAGCGANLYGVMLGNSSGNGTVISLGDSTSQILLRANTEITLQTDTIITTGNIDLSGLPSFDNNAACTLRVGLAYVTTGGDITLPKGIVMRKY